MLDKLPAELLDEVLQQIPAAKDLASLSLTCRTLHDHVEKAGWKILTRSRHPFAGLPLDFADWKDAAHGLATLSRNLRRRAIIATYPEPETHIVALPGREVKASWKRPTGQTMGFQPVIDSYSTLVGGSWSSQAEVVAWSAGAELVIRRQERGKRAAERWQEAPPEQRQKLFNQHRHAREWLTYRHAQHREGYDDITSLNLMQPHQMEQQPAPEGAETVIVGRASGSLAMLQLSSQSGRHVVKKFDTAWSPVRSGSLMTGPEPLLAASLGDDDVALFSIQPDDNLAAPLSRIACDTALDKPSTRTWSTAFLGRQALAVGRGPSKGIVSIYSMQASGLGKTPVRVFKSDSRMATSVYALAPLPTPSADDSTSTELFLSGAYDGLIRLHDVRSPSDCEVVISDPIDHSPVFSLLSLGRERVVAGGGTNSLLKFFDLRMAGRRGFFCTDVDAAQEQSEQDVDARAGWNLFGQPRDRVHNALSSPVYSLSRPSPWSNNIFAGMESSVLQLNFIAAHDEYPDPLFRSQKILSMRSRINTVKTWDSQQDPVRDLTMYEHNEVGQFILLNQEPLRRPPQLPHNRTDGMDQYDSRWRRAESYRGTFRGPHSSEHRPRMGTHRRR